MRKRVPVFRQLESSDCGPTCLQMVIAYYGKRLSLKTLKSHFDITKLGVSVGEIIECAEKTGMTAKAVKINLAELHRMPLPGILFWNQGHFVVLEEIAGRDKKTYKIVDPEYGRLNLEVVDLNGKWLTNGHGIAIVLAPNEGFDEIPSDTHIIREERRKVWRTIKNLYGQHKKKLLLTAVLSLVTMFMSWAMPIILKKTIDDGIMAGDINMVWTLLFCQLLFFIGFIVSNNLITLILAKAGFRIGIDMMSDYLNKVIRLPMSFFDRKFRSDLIQRITDQERIKTFITSSVNNMVFTVLNFIVFSAILLYFNWIVFLLFLFFGLSSLFWNLLFLRRRKYLDYSFFSANSEQRNNIYELIMGMSEIKINNAQHHRVGIWENLQNRINKLTLKSIYLNYYMNNGTVFFNRLKDIVITGLCALLVIKGQMTLGTMMTVSYLLGMLSGPMEQMYGFSTVLQDLKLSHDRLSEIMDMEVDDDSGKKKPEELAGRPDIRFEDMWFKYKGSFSKYVLSNINLSIQTGKITAIVGTSGSGKTTLLKLMLGFYDPQKGRVMIDGEDMTNVDMGRWRDRCGVVMQEGYIFSGTIADNIALSDSDPDPERLVAAARGACLMDYIDNLPMGFHTKIGETGISMSGGQKQRLFIARAIYKNPDSYFFDEATSSLDANNERDIVGNLTEIYRGKTVVIIAHRLSTVRTADKIVFLKEGRVTEQGTHQELIRQRGDYYNLVKNQLELGE